MAKRSENHTKLFPVQAPSSLVRQQNSIYGTQSVKALRKEATGWCCNSNPATI
jgi:hypothetical protein